MITASREDLYAAMFQATFLASWCLPMQRCNLTGILLCFPFSIIQFVTPCKISIGLSRNATMCIDKLMGDFQCIKCAQSRQWFVTQCYPQRIEKLMGEFQCIKCVQSLKRFGTRLKLRKCKHLIKISVLKRCYLHLFCGRKVSERFPVGTCSG